jgi:hypothetical protein
LINATTLAGADELAMNLWKNPLPNFSTLKAFLPKLPSHRSQVRQCTVSKTFQLVEKRTSSARIGVGES